MFSQNPRQRAINLIGQLLSTKQDAENPISGQIGTYDDNGNKIVYVPNRTNFIYVRIAGALDEVIQAFNQTVFPQWDVKVLLLPSKSGHFYEVTGRDLGQYSDWGSSVNAFYFPHALQHSFGDGSQQGSDPVFIYKRQLLQPMSLRPNATGSMSAYVEADFYEWNGQVQYFPGSSTVDFTPLISTGSYARYMTVYLNGTTNSLGYITGSTFVPNVFTTGTIGFISGISPAIGMPLGAVYLSTGITTIGWSQLFDLRSFLGGGAQAHIIADATTTYPNESKLKFITTGNGTVQITVRDDPVNNSTNIYISGTLSPALAYVTGTGNIAGGTGTIVGTITIPSGTLANNGYSIEFEAGGIFANTGSVNKAIQVVFGTGTIIYDSLALSITTGTNWMLMGRIIRTDLTSEECMVSLDTSSSVKTSDSSFVHTTLDVRTTLQISIVVRGQNKNDVVLKIFWARIVPM